MFRPSAISSIQPNFDWGMHNLKCDNGSFRIMPSSIIIGYSQMLKKVISPKCYAVTLDNNKFLWVLIIIIFSKLFARNVQDLKHDNNKKMPCILRAKSFDTKQKLLAAESFTIKLKSAKLFFFTFWKEFATKGTKRAKIENNSNNQIHCGKHPQ